MITPAAPAPARPREGLEPARGVRRPRGVRVAMRAARVAAAGRPPPRGRRGGRKDDVRGAAAAPGPAVGGQPAPVTPGPGDRTAAPASGRTLAGTRARRSLGRWNQRPVEEFRKLKELRRCSSLHQILCRNATL